MDGGYSGWNAEYRAWQEADSERVAAIREAVYSGEALEWWERQVSQDEIERSMHEWQAQVNQRMREKAQDQQISTEKPFGMSLDEPEMDRQIAATRRRRTEASGTALAWQIDNRTGQEEDA